MQIRSNHQNLFILLLTLVLTIVAWQVPHGDYIVYPFSLLAVWFHEMGHGLTAVLLGGTFDQIEVTLQAGGLATFSQSDFGAGAKALVAIGGLLGPAIAGSLLVLLSQSRSLTTLALSSLGTAMVLSTFLLGKTSLGMWLIAGIGSLLILTAFKGSIGLKQFLINLLGVQTSISVFRRLDYLFMAQADLGQGRILPSDSAIIANNLFFPVIFWGTLLSLISVGLLSLSLYLAFHLRQPNRN